MFSKDEVIKNINGLIDSAGRTSGSLSAHYERRIDEVEAALAVLGYKVEYDEDNFHAVDMAAITKSKRYMEAEANYERAIRMRDARTSGYEYMGIPVHRFDIDFPGGRVSIDASDAGSERFYAIRRALGTTGLSELMPGPSLGPDGIISTRFEEI